jgi:hypothetical protein
VRGSRGNYMERRRKKRNVLSLYVPFDHQIQSYLPNAETKTPLRPSSRMRREPVFCLSFATLAVFLGRNYTFDSTLTQTRLSLRRTGLTDNTVLWNDFEWGLHERQRAKQTDTGVEVKKEADRDNEAKSAQTNQWADSWPSSGFEHDRAPELQSRLALAYVAIAKRRPMLTISSRRIRGETSTSWPGAAS